MRGVYPSVSQFVFVYLVPSTFFYMRLSIRRSVYRSVPCFFQKTNIVDFLDGKSSNAIINNATMSDDKVVASYEPPWAFFLSCSLPFFHTFVRLFFLLFYLPFFYSFVSVPRGYYYFAYPCTYMAILILEQI